MIDGTIAAQKAMSAIVRTGERFGTEHLTNLLIGEDTEAILKFGHDRLPTFGVGKEHGKQEWRSIFRQLHGAGIIALDVTGYGRWTVTDAGRRVLKGAAKVELRKDTLKPAAKKAARAAAKPRRWPTARPATRRCSRRCKRAARRSPRSSASPAYVVFADKSLIDMARRKPTTIGRDGRGARRRRGQAAAIRRDFPRGDPAARGGPKPHRFPQRHREARKTGLRVLPRVSRCCTAIRRCVSNAAIFAGSRGCSASSRENPSPT